jgi:hypothetical protein
MGVKNIHEDAILQGSLKIYSNTTITSTTQICFHVPLPQGIIPKVRNTSIWSGVKVLGIV